MEKQNESMRERLLARLPQPGNLAAYREETASLLAKHEKALFWKRMPSKALYVIASAIAVTCIFWGQKLNWSTAHFMWFWAVFFSFGGVLDLKYRIYRSKVDLLVELKRVQLQILEIQASLQKQRSSE